MVRTIDIKVVYSLDDEEYFDSIVPPDVVEKNVYDRYLEDFADDEGFLCMGVRVDDS